MKDKVRILIENGKTISIMESCTGGLLASTITDCSGASDIFPGGFVTYSNDAKVMHGVPAEIIDRFGVYSAETAAAMAKACADAYGTDIGIGITGSLGRKDPNNPDSEVGKVYYSIIIDDAVINTELTIPDGMTNRHEMKEFIVNDVLDNLIFAEVSREATVSDNTLGACFMGPGTTPDGYTVDANGAWTVNGIVQTR